MASAPRSRESPRSRSSDAWHASIGSDALHRLPWRRPGRKWARRRGLHPGRRPVCARLPNAVVGRRSAMQSAHPEERPIHAATVSSIACRHWMTLDVVGGLAPNAHCQPETIRRREQSFGRPGRHCVDASLERPPGRRTSRCPTPRYPSLNRRSGRPGLAGISTSPLHWDPQSVSRRPRETALMPARAERDRQRRPSYLALRRPRPDARPNRLRFGRSLRYSFRCQFGSSNFKSRTNGFRTSDDPRDTRRTGLESPVSAAACESISSTSQRRSLRRI